MFDLETGKVVQEIGTGKDQINFKRISNDRKNGQKDPNQVLYGIDFNGVY